MQGGRGRGRGRGRGDPFSFSGFGGMPFPSLFGSGGRDPLDDPFFTQPFGGNGMFQPSPFMGVPPFGSSLFSPDGRSPFMDAHAHTPTLYDHIPNTSRGPIIEELNSDDEKEEPEAQLSVMRDTHSRPQAHSFSFQSSSVTYGGSNGAYYTSSTTRRAGSDGVRFEEYKEADSVSGEAAHRISRGIHDKGHTVSRHLKSDGHVDTMQHCITSTKMKLMGLKRRGKEGVVGHWLQVQAGEDDWVQVSMHNHQNLGDVE
ncbi:unnamed protein product [Lactuca virosa]|uniref:Glycine-rich protein n=1 Tax=Lactuca virosa TaxID=75947 RepID=A0AAU9LJ87_9ASTR|nr:unnamed protein product [Lactuca virosa]